MPATLELDLKIDEPKNIPIAEDPPQCSEWLDDWGASAGMRLCSRTATKLVAGAAFCWQHAGQREEQEHLLGDRMTRCFFCNGWDSASIRRYEEFVCDRCAAWGLERRMMWALAQHYQSAGMSVEPEYQTPTGRVDLMVVSDPRIFIEGKTSRPVTGIGQLISYDLSVGGGNELILAVPKKLVSDHLERVCDRFQVQLLGLTVPGWVWSFGISVNTNGYWS